MSAAERHNVTESGRPDGPAMVFAHGFGCDQNMWRFVAPAFEDRFRVILFDHAGAGGSAPDAYDVARHGSLEGYAQDVVELCRELGVTDGVFVGHSVSAMIGVLADLQAPELFARLVMVGPSARYINDEGYVGGFTESDIRELLDSLDSNYLGWSSVMAPTIMGNPDRRTAVHAGRDRADRGRAVRRRHDAERRAGDARRHRPLPQPECTRGDGRGDEPVPRRCHRRAMSSEAVTEAFYAALLDDDPEQLYDRAPCGYLTTTSGGMIVKANATFLDLTGFSREQLVGQRRFADLLNAGGRIYHETHFAPMLQMQGTVREVAFDLVRADGSRLPVLVNAVLETAPDGAPH